jgi:hypothetical protein
MTTNHHTPITDGEQGSAETFNSRFAELDEAIGELTNSFEPSITGWQTLSANLAEIEIASIPAGFNGLKLIALVRSTTAATKTSLILQLNGDAAEEHYFARHVEVEGSVTLTAQTGSGTAGFDMQDCCTGASAPSGYYGLLEVTILRYQDVTARPMLYYGYCQGQASTELKLHEGGGQYLGEAAVTSLTLIPGAGDFASGSKYVLYGMN